ncbi:putative adipose-regulatory protein (Seipin) [Tasmannia lanceolata]|uniref:putative adipose-regulatory protein (Seipin) n=1 Tax=Tasmannia lanceolata TaxID=3420 RepID=UPI004062975B
METHLSKPHHRRTLAPTTTNPPLPPYSEYNDHNDLFLLKPTSWFIQFIAFQIEIISSPIITIFSMASTSLRLAEETKDKAEKAVKSVPSRLGHGVGLVLRKLGFGFFGAVYASLVLLALFIVAVLIGVCLVWFWVDEPVFMREALHFDYTEPNPVAFISFGKKRRAVPLGHTLHVSVFLLMPDSDYNHRVGVFQLTAEVISATGSIIAKSSQPCMLHYHSLPVRLMRTFIMSVPILIGISSETQKITVEILKYKEGNPKTEMIRVWLKPRAGTTDLPLLYTAKILMNSQLPRWKELVHKWKWTFYVWASLYVYVMLLIILVYYFKPFVFPKTIGQHENQINRSIRVVRDWQSSVGGAGESSDSDRLRKWRQSRNKRKALMFSRGVSPDGVGCSGSSVGREKMGEGVEDSGDLLDPVGSVLSVTREDMEVVVEDSGELAASESEFVGF